MHFSIIIPAKNEAANIGRCLDSIANVDWDSSQYEVIVVDNGSIDKTVDIAREKGARVYIEKELTIAGLRNFGALTSAGEILAFLDADCAVDKQWLAAASFYLNDSDDVSAFGSPVLVPSGATWVQEAWFLVRGKPEELADVEWLESANLFVKRRAFEAVNGFNESLITCEDYDLTQRLRVVGRLVSDFRIKAIHYREPATLSDFVKKEKWRGASNYSRLFERKVDLREFPSLVLPLVYLVLLVSVPLLSIFSSSLPDHLVYLAPVSILLWQTPILLMSIKTGMKSGAITVLQLCLLINAYFLARSLAILGLFRREKRLGFLDGNQS